MSYKQVVGVVTVPRGCEKGGDGKYVLKCSAVFSLSFESVQNGGTPKDLLTWPLVSGFFAGTGDEIWKRVSDPPLRLVIDTKTLESPDVRFNDARLESIKYKYKDKELDEKLIVQSPATRNLWELLIPDGNTVWVRPTEGRDEVAKVEKVPEISDNASDLKSAVRSGADTIEGVRSDDVNPVVCAGMAMAALTDENAGTGRVGIPPSDELGETARSNWHTALRKMEHAVERQSLLGSAGATSAALEREYSHQAGSDEPGKEEDLRNEFHHRLAALDEYPHLQLLLGLIVDFDVLLDQQSFEEFRAESETRLLTIKTQFRGGLEDIEIISFKTSVKLGLNDGVPTFFATPDANSFLDAEHRCVKPCAIDTVQWDLQSGLRSVLRSNGYLDDSNQLHSARAPAGYGVTVFWKNNGLNLSEVAKNSRIKPDLEDIFKADDLIMGFLPAIKWKDQWRSVTSRKLSLKLGDEKELEWEDEKPLTPSNVEAPQPVTGWLIDYISPEPGKLIEYFIVSTAIGLVVVQEGLDSRERDTSLESYTGSLSRYFGSGKSGVTVPLLGHYVQLRAERNTENGVYQLKNAEIRFGQGIAGPVPPDSWKHRDKTVYFKIKRRSVFESDSNFSDEGFVFLRGEKLAGLAPKNGESLFFQGRGDRAIVLEDDVEEDVKANGLDPVGIATCSPPKDGVLMRFEADDGDLLHFELTDPRIDTGSQGLARSVRLKPDRGSTAVATLFDPESKDLTKLAFGSVYRVYAKYFFNHDSPKQSELRVEKIFEEARPEAARFVRMFAEGENYYAEFRFDSADATAIYSLDGEPIVELLESVTVSRDLSGKAYEGFKLVPIQVIGDGTLPEIDVDAENISSEGFDDNDEEHSNPTLLRSGTWADLGPLIGERDECLLEFSRIEPISVEGGRQVRSRLRRVQVAWSDHQRTILGIVSARPTEGHVYRDEQRFHLIPLDGGVEHEFEINKETRIVALPEDLSKATTFRMWNHPPMGLPVRVTLEYPGSLRATRVEVVNRLPLSSGEFQLLESSDPPMGKIQVLSHFKNFKGFEIRPTKFEEDQKSLFPDSGYDLKILLVDDFLSIPELIGKKRTLVIARKSGTHDLRFEIHDGTNDPYIFDSNNPGDKSVALEGIKEMLRSVWKTRSFPSTQGDRIKNAVLSLLDYPVKGVSNRAFLICDTSSARPSVSLSVEFEQGEQTKILVFRDRNDPELKDKEPPEGGNPPCLIQVVEAPDRVASNDKKSGEIGDSVANEFEMNEAVALTLSVPEKLPELAVGRRVPVFAEAPVLRRRHMHYELLRLAYETGFPLETDSNFAKFGLFIDNANDPSKDWDLIGIGPSVSKLVAPPVAGVEQVFTKESLSNINLPGGNLPGVTLFRAGLDCHVRNPTSITESKPLIFDWIFEWSGEVKKSISNLVTIEPKGSFPVKDRVPPSWFRSSDQVIVDDVLMQWNGWSLSVDPTHWKERVESERKKLAENESQRAEYLKPLLDVSTELPGPRTLPSLRIGESYDINFRSVDVAGNHVELKSLNTVPTVRFHPFSREFSSGGAQSVLRFMPLGAPVVWNQNQWQAPRLIGESDFDLLFPSSLFMKSARFELPPPVDSAENGKSTNPPKVPNGFVAESLPLSLFPPPVHWQLAEWLGVFDSAVSADTYKRIAGSSDWEQVPGYQFDNPKVNCLWHDTVKDPDVGGYLVVLGGREVIYIRWDDRIDADLKTLDLKRGEGVPVPTNPLSGEIPEWRKFGDLKQNSNSSLECVIPPDAEWEIRIYALPKNDKLESMQLASLASCKATDQASAKTIQKGGSEGSGNLGGTATASNSLWLLNEAAKFLAEFSQRGDGGILSQEEYTARLLLHPWTSSPRIIRIRHITNQPYQAPELVSLKMAQRNMGQTDGFFQLGCKVHRPSTGSVVVQAALEEEYVDDVRSPLPRVPDEELMRVLEDSALRDEARQRLLDWEHEMERMRRSDRGSEGSKAHGTTTTEKSKTGGENIGIAKSKTADEPGAVQFLGRPSDLTDYLGRPPLDVTTIVPASNLSVDAHGPDLHSCQFSHEFFDTRHRTVYYRGIAQTRYGHLPEAFGEEGVETNPPTLHKLAPSDSWARVEVPATVRPANLVVADVTILLEWSGGRGTHERSWHQSWTGGWQFSRTRRSGHRIWLERPWYSSGSGEKLAVLLWMDANVEWDRAGEYQELVSRWAVDPVFETTLPKGGERGTGLGVLTREDFLLPWSAPLGLRSSPIRNETEVGETNQTDTKQTEEKKPEIKDSVLDTLPVGLAVYQPRFDPERRLWYADVFVEPKSYTPFVAYSVARYQPCSLPECALSAPERIHPVQILPPRTLTVTAAAPGLIELDVRLSGIFPPQNRRRIVVRIERNEFVEESTSYAPDDDAILDTELGWAPVPLLDITGSIVEEVIIEDPVILAGGPNNRNGEVGFKVTLPEVPFHHSRLADRKGISTSKERDDSHPCRFLRLSVAEDELYPAAHAMPEDQRFLPRRVYLDQIFLPRELLKVSRSEPDLRGPSHEGGPTAAERNDRPEIDYPLPPPAFPPNY